jgi:hypothetical protein
VANYTYSDAQSLITQAANLQLAGDYAGAAAQLEAAITIIAGLPEGEQGDASFSYQTDKLQAQANHLRRLARGSTGITSKRLRYVPPTTSGDYD